MALLELRSLTKRHSPARRGAAEVMIGPLSLQLETRECLAVVGPSGSGKTTLLRLIAGLEEPNSGSLLLDGVDVTLAPAHERPFAWVSQEGALYPQKTVAENLRFTLDRRGVKDTDARVREMASLLRLENRLDHLPANLSGGERQRAALARALAMRPQLLLLDEPLASLDACLRVALRREIAPMLRQLGIACLWVTHDQSEAFAVGQRVAVMQEGVIVQTGSHEELTNHPANAFVAAFIGEPPMSLIRGKLASETNGFFFEPEGAPQRLPIDPALNSSCVALAGHNVLLGVRETDWEVTTSGQGSIKATVVHHERAGRTWVAVTRVGPQTLAIQTKQPYPAGQDLHLRPHWEKVFLFQAD